MDKEERLRRVHKDVRPRPPLRVHAVGEDVQVSVSTDASVA